MSSRQYIFLNPGLMSGSDPLRTRIGGFWELDGEDDEVDAVFTAFGDVAGSSTNGVTTTLEDDSIITSIHSGWAWDTTASADLVIPNFKMPIKVLGNEATIEDDDDWRSKIVTVLGPSRFTDTNFQYTLPYSPLYIKSHSTFQLFC